MSTDDIAIEVLTQLSRRMTASRRMLILLRLAFCQHKAQEYRAAHATIEQVLALDPENSGALRMAEANGLGCSPANSPEIGVGPPDPPYFRDGCISTHQGVLGRTNCEYRSASRCYGRRPEATRFSSSDSGTFPQS
jgi:hypothetical protein